MAGTKGVPRFSQALLAEHAEGLVALSGCRDGELARRLRVGDRDGARAVAERYARLFGRGDAPGRPAASSSSSRTTCSPTTTGSSRSRRRWPSELGLPVVVTNDVHYARPEDRELADVLTAIRHGRTLDTLGDLRRPDGESYLKSGAELAAACRRVVAARAGSPRRGRRGIATSVELAASCSVDLEFEQYRFPGFPVPDGETPFSYLSELCWAGARRRYHPLTSAVVTRLAHELDVIERAGLAEFFLICWDLMRFAKEQGIPAQGRGSATSSIVSYTLGISRVEPITHNLLFERFINPGRTTYPDVDIDFSSERREEVIQYVYRRYGPEHTGMVCNLVTYRARSAVREVGYALGFPRPLVDRVAKALETYDSVMVRRDLEADGGFAEFFRRPGDGLPGEVRAADRAEAHGLVDGMGQLNTADPARRQGAALAPATDAGGPERATTVRLARGERGEPRRAGPVTAASDARTTRLDGVSVATGAERIALAGAGRRSGAAGRRFATGSAGRRPTTRAAGRHPGERRLAAGGPRDRVRADAIGWCAAAHRRPAVDPESGQLGRRPRRRTGRPPTSWVDPAHWDPPAPRRATRARRPPVVGRADWNPSRRRRPAAARRSASPTGSAGWSSAPASTASRATCRSIRAGCS